MLVRELPEKEGQSPGWICGSCHTVWFDKELAEGCCMPAKCQQCGSSTAPGRSICIPCSDRQRLVYEENLFRSAQKVFFVDYEGRYIYWVPPGTEVGEFFVSKTEVEKFCEQKNIIPPRWCWAVEQVGFLLDAEQVLAGAVTRTNEEVRPLLADEQVEELQKLLDDWAMKTELKSYDVDYEVAVILDRDLYEAVNEKKSSSGS
jgi:hypothetical protein